MNTGSYSQSALFRSPGRDRQSPPSPSARMALTGKQTHCKIRSASSCASSPPGTTRFHRGFGSSPAPSPCRNRDTAYFPLPSVFPDPDDTTIPAPPQGRGRTHIRPFANSGKICYDTAAGRKSRKGCFPGPADGILPGLHAFSAKSQAGTILHRRRCI